MPKTRPCPACGGGPFLEWDEIELDLWEREEPRRIHMVLCLACRHGAGRKPTLVED